MQPVNGVDQAHEAATISSPPTEHSEDLPQLPEDLKVKLKEPLPREAVSPNPQKPGLSGIKVIYVVERLNDVFGLNGWHIDNEIVETGRMVVVRATLTIPKYSIAIEQFGGNDNPDRGDAYKGACTVSFRQACVTAVAGIVRVKLWPTGDRLCLAETLRRCLKLSSSYKRSWTSGAVRRRGGPSCRSHSGRPPSTSPRSTDFSGRRTHCDWITCA